MVFSSGSPGFSDRVAQSSAVSGFGWWLEVVKFLFVKIPMIVNLQKNRCPVSHEFPPTAFYIGAHPPPLSLIHFTYND